MTRRHTFRHRNLYALCFLSMMLAPSLSAQDIAQKNEASKAQDTSQSATKPSAAIKENTIAVLPWIYAKGAKERYYPGTDGAQKKAQEVRDKLLSYYGLTALPEGQTVSAFGVGTMQGNDLPTPEQMLAVGIKLGTQYVLCGRIQWHTRDIYVFPTTRKKSTCNVDLVVVDVKQSRVVLNARDIHVDSHAKGNGGHIAATVLIGMGIGLVGSGPKTPHEERAAVLTITQAMEPWLKTFEKPIILTPKP